MLFFKFQHDFFVVVDDNNNSGGFCLQGEGPCQFDQVRQEDTQDQAWDEKAWIPPVRQGG